MSDDDLSLEKLSDLTGVERRTLRDWVADGLLAAPVRVGRGALYPVANLDRALAVRALRDIHGLSRAEIRARLMSAREAEIAAWAAEARGLNPGPAPSSARAYLAALAEDAPPGRGPTSGTPGQVWFGERAGPTPPEPAGIEALLAVLEAAARVPSVKRSRGAARFDIPITPNLDLTVRGEVSPRDRAMLERVADLIRAILTGGHRDDQP